jgi:DNA-binding ferritin-like protein
MIGGAARDKNLEPDLSRVRRERSLTGEAADITVTGFITSLTVSAKFATRIRRSGNHVDALSSTLATHGKSVRRTIDESDELGDRNAADIFTEISRGSDKYLWFVEAHLG